MRWLERQALLAVITVAGWVFGESRAVLGWAHGRLERLEGFAEEDGG